jgi:transposase
LSKLETGGGGNGVRLTRVFREALGLVDTVVESAFLDFAADDLIIAVRPRAGAAGRCGQCGRRCPSYDQGSGRRRWRAPDLGRLRCFVEADAPRVTCPEHGVVVAAVPWARHDSRHTRDFDQNVAWLVRGMSRTAVSQWLRIAWDTVGAIVTRVMADANAAAGDRLAGVRRIGIDEISYKRGHKYLVVVVDHDTGRLLWAKPGRDKKTVAEFFDLLGEDRCDQIELVSADGADWIADVVGLRCPNVQLCVDPFHVVSWATQALDLVRREVWNAARRTSQSELARGLKGSRFALLKNPENLTINQQRKLAWIAKADPKLYRAYRLKELFREVFAPGGPERILLFDAWLRLASRSKIEPFVDLARRVRRYRDDIANTLTHKLSNARVEAINTKIRLLTRIAYGFKHAHALIALIMLHLGGYNLTLPGRPQPQPTHGNARRAS